MRFLKTLILVLFVGTAVIAVRSMNFSKPADAKKTGKPCLYCHTKYGSKELTEAGKYYKENGTLDGYEEKGDK